MCNCSFCNRPTCICTEADIKRQNALMAGRRQYIPVLDDTVNYGQSWSPAQHCRSRP